MRDLLSFLGFLITNKPDNLETPLWGVESIIILPDGKTTITRSLHVGGLVEDEFYFPENGTLVRISGSGRVNTFQRQKEEP